MSLKGPTRRLALLAVLGGARLLVGWSSRTASLSLLLGHTECHLLGGCANLGLGRPGLLAILCGEDLLDVLKIEEHGPRRFRNRAVVHLVLVPPVRRTGGQHDACQSSLVEGYAPLLGGSNRQQTVAKRMQMANVAI
jgi:hypothetical protein